MINFRLDEDVKKNMEESCKDMGMSMTMAFMIFAIKVAKGKYLLRLQPILFAMMEYFFDRMMFGSKIRQSLGCV